MISAAEAVGYHLGQEGSLYQETLLELAEIVLVPLTLNVAYDFGNSSIPQQLMQRIEPLKSDQSFWEVPPVDVAYIHRKIGGLFMLAARLNASVNVHEILVPWLQNRS